MLKWLAGHDTYDDWDAPGWPKPKLPKPTYGGATLGTPKGRSIQVMSDIWEWREYAPVWDGTRVTEVDVEGAVVTVDATPEVLAAVKRWEAAREAAREKAARVEAVERMAREARKVERDKVVTVVRGRKVPVGTEGRVFWKGESRFGMRVGLELANGERVFTALGNVEVTNPDEWMDVGEAMSLLAA